MKTAEIVEGLYMSDFKDKKLLKKLKEISKVKDKKYNHTYLGVPCKLIGSRKIMRDIEFKDGSETSIDYNELNS